MAADTNLNLRLESELNRFQELVRSRSHDELAQCVRILGMYLALYKNRFGDIPACDYRRLEDAAAPGDELSAILTRGIEEAYAMLSLVAGGDPQGVECAPGPPRSRFIN